MKILPPRNTLRLSAVLPSAGVARDGSFSYLDQVPPACPGALVYCATVKFLNAAVASPDVAAILTTPHLGQRVADKALALSEDPRLEFFRLYRRLALEGLLVPRMEYGRASSCRIHPTALVSERSFVAAGVVIEANAFVGDNVYLAEGAYVGQGASIGVDGLMPVWDEQGAALRLPHAGSVMIGENVAIVGSSVVVRAVFQRPTTIGHDSFIGLLTTIGHDVQIGARCVIGGNCVIAGGVVIGDGARVWASASLSHGCRVGQDGCIQIGSVVIDDVDAGRAVSGNFAYGHRRHALDRLKDSS